MNFDEEIPKHYKSRKGKKPFKIEALLISDFWDFGWNTWGRYKTAKQRDQAFEAITAKRRAGNWKFRKVDE